jgi:hypothetical protein
VVTTIGLDHGMAVVSCRETWAESDNQLCRFHPYFRGRLSHPPVYHHHRFKLVSTFRHWVYQYRDYTFFQGRFDELHILNSATMEIFNFNFSGIDRFGQGHQPSHREWFLDLDHHHIKSAAV